MRAGKGGFGDLREFRVLLRTDVDVVTSVDSMTRSEDVSC